jgi:hypothetical protein
LHESCEALVYMRFKFIEESKFFAVIPLELQLFDMAGKVFEVR